MSASKKNTPPVAEKLVPRTAPKVEALPADEAPMVAPAPVVSAPAVAKTAAKKKPSELDDIKARNKKALADALAKAQAVKITQPLGQTVPAPPKVGKPAKEKKAKLVRDSYAMPEAEYAQIAVLKKRLVGLGAGATKKSELLRAGIALLAALNDAELAAVMGRVERIKTGRPAK